uniref:AMDV2_9 n=1 Tax=uncultured virus TaxID=340016 RepID=B3GAK8_9VIRU|nr:AMDV2_9 [uncultured virus]
MIKKLIAIFFVMLFIFSGLIVLESHNNYNQNYNIKNKINSFSVNSFSVSSIPLTNKFNISFNNSKNPIVRPYIYQNFYFNYSKSNSVLYITNMTSLKMVNFSAKFPYGNTELYYYGFKNNVIIYSDRQGSSLVLDFNLTTLSMVTIPSISSIQYFLPEEWNNTLYFLYTADVLNRYGEPAYRYYIGIYNISGNSINIIYSSPIQPNYGRSPLFLVNNNYVLMAYKSIYGFNRLYVTNLNASNPLKIVPKCYTNPVCLQSRYSYTIIKNNILYGYDWYITPNESLFQNPINNSLPIVTGNNVQYQGLVDYSGLHNNIYFYNNVIHIYNTTYSFKNPNQLHIQNNGITLDSIDNPNRINFLNCSSNIVYSLIIYSSFEMRYCLNINSFTRSSLSINNYYLYNNVISSKKSYHFSEINMPYSFKILPLNYSNYNYNSSAIYFTINDFKSGNPNIKYYNLSIYYNVIGSPSAPILQIWSYIPIISILMLFVMSGIIINGVRKTKRGYV